MRSLLRAAVGVAALGALAWTVFPGVIAMVLPPGLMLARCLMIGGTFAIAWVCLGLAPERPPSRREIAASVSAAGLVLIAGVGLFGYNSYQERQGEISRSAQAREAKATFEDCKKQVESKPDPKVNTELDVWMNCNSK